MDREEMLKIISNVVINKSFILVHGISKSQDVRETSKRILQSGLYHHYKGGFNSNSVAFGEFGQFDFYKIFKYKYSCDNNKLCANVIIAIPKVMYDMNDNGYFIGPFEDLYLGNDENRIRRVCKHPFNAWINFRGHVMREFILGVYIRKYLTDDPIEFILNEEYIGLKSYEEQKCFFEKIKSQLVGFGLRNLNDKYYFTDEDSFYGGNFLEYLDVNCDRLQKVRKQ